MKKFIIKETKESFSSIHELRQHALIEQIKDYTLIVKDDKQMTEGITWINCIDQMPPDGIGSVILNDIRGCLLFKALNPKLPKELSDKLRWTPYTNEKWEELNK